MAVIVKRQRNRNIRLRARTQRRAALHLIEVEGDFVGRRVFLPHLLHRVVDLVVDPVGDGGFVAVPITCGDVCDILQVGSVIARLFQGEGDLVRVFIIKFSFRHTTINFRNRVLRFVLRDDAITVAVLKN